jgi:hypothetical protein
MNVEQMQDHIASLCEANDIIYRFNNGDPDAAVGSYWLREIEIPPITDERSYATALHEIGHILGWHQLSEVILVREQGRRRARQENQEHLSRLLSPLTKAEVEEKSTATSP